MAKINLNNVSGGYNLTTINSNFKKLQDTLNDQVLYRDNPINEPNQMENDLDMNGERIYNLPEPTLDHEPARYKEFKDIKPLFDQAHQDAIIAAAAAVSAGASAVASQNSADYSQSQAILASQFASQAEQSRDYAEAAIITVQDNVEESREILVEVQEARDDAFAAAGAIGPIKFYLTYAEAQADLPNLSNGNLVEVSVDETRASARTRYRVISGALSFILNLDQVRVDLFDPTKGASLVRYQPKGTNTSPQTLSNLARQTVSVLDYGVLGNGDPLDVLGFDRAIVDAAAKGWKVTVPAGDFVLDGAIRTTTDKVNNTNYIFLAPNGIEIEFDKGAVLHFRNGFKGFRFRPVADPTPSTPRTAVVTISGGQVEGTANGSSFGVTTSPNIWAFIAENYKVFNVTNVLIRDMYATAGIASYYNTFADIQHNVLSNVWANSSSDAFGDGIYIAWTEKYNVSNNIVTNDVNLAGADYGRIGIVLEYDLTRDGIVENNTIEGYDRAVHIELIKGTAVVASNKFKGCLSGVVAWNNYGFAQHIFNNEYTNEGCPIAGKNPRLYTSAAILFLQANTNNGSIVRHNRIKVVAGFAKPAMLTSATSSNMLFEDNQFVDDTKTLAVDIAQGFSSAMPSTGVVWRRNQIKASSIGSSDARSFIFEMNTVEAGTIRFAVIPTAGELAVAFYRAGDNRIKRLQGIVERNTLANAGLSMILRINGVIRFNNNVVRLPSTNSGERVFQNLLPIHALVAPFNAVIESSGNEFYVDRAGPTAFLFLFESTNLQGIYSRESNVAVNTLNAVDTRTFAGGGNIAIGGGRVNITSNIVPATGEWITGDTYTIPNPVAGGFIGGVCITAPNTWKTYGPITA